jgi:4-amino-4-deoxy-L-arabinose transferase-like glycosyltransferase
MSRATVALFDTLRTGQTSIVWSLAALALFFRILLAAYCPTSFGYVYDYYHEGVELMYAKGRLPIAEDCWQCYHPPLYYVLGLPFYAAGYSLATDPDDAPDLGLRGLTGLALVAGAMTAFFSDRVVRRLEPDPALRVIGTGLVLAFPCLFISSYGPDADIVVAATMTMFLAAFVRFARDPGTQSVPGAIGIGVLAGLAASAKYSGLIALATAGVVLGWQLLFSPGRLRTIRLGLIVLAAALAVGSWKYVDNARRYGNALHANGSAEDAFEEQHDYYWDRYDFWSFRPGLILEASAPDGPKGMLTSLPVYRSVWTTLYGMAWGDLSFFSVPGRIDDPAAPYPWKHIPAWLTATVLFLGLVPTLLAAVGMASTIARREYLPLHVMLALTLSSYLMWVVAQDDWALKTKYLLFLLPVYVTYALAGLRLVRERLPQLISTAAASLLIALVVSAHLYLFAFAVGHL